MKTHSIQFASACITCAILGFVTGWFAKPHPNDNTHHAGNQDTDPSGHRNQNWDFYDHETPSPEWRRGTKQRPAASQKHQLSHQEQLMAEIAAMPTISFAHELAKLIHDVEFTPESLERKAALFRAMNAEKALTTYFEYKKTYGIALNQRDPKLQSLLIQAATLDGAYGVERIFKESPNGIEEFGNFMHGWGKANPHAAVDWFNSMKSDHPQYKYALHGLFFGLAESDPAYAQQAFHTLDAEIMKPGDLQTASSSITSSLISSHSASAAETFVQSLPENFRVPAIEQSLWSVDRRPVEEMVPWLVTYAKDSGSIRHTVHTQLAQWAKADPTTALAWVSNISATDPDLNFGNGLFQRVAGNIDPQSLQTWLNSHPEHPASMTAYEILNPAP